MVHWTDRKECKLKIVAVCKKDVPEQHADTSITTFGQMQALVDGGRAASIVNRGGKWTMLDDADRTAPFVDAGIVVHDGASVAEVRAFLAAVR